MYGIEVRPVSPSVTKSFRITRQVYITLFEFTQKEIKSKENLDAALKAGLGFDLASLARTGGVRSAFQSLEN